MRDEILCVILRMAQNKNQNKEITETHKGARLEGKKSNKAQCGNQGSPQSGSPRSQGLAVRHDVTPRHFEANTDNAGSQREWWEACGGSIPRWSASKPQVVTRRKAKGASEKKKQREW